MAEKIRILHIFYAFSTGGMESNLLNFFDRADFERFEHFIFIARDEGVLKERYHKLPVRIFTLRCSPPRYFFYSLPMGYYLCKKHRIQIIHGHNYGAYRYGYFLSLLTGIPLFTSNYGLGTWKKKRNLFLESIIFRRAKVNISLSQAILDKEIALLKGKAHPRAAFKVVYPIIRDISPESLPTLDQKGIRQKLGIANDKPILTIIGRVHRVKGHRLAIDALDRINQDEVKANLLIVGPKVDPSVLGEGDLRKKYIRFLDYYEPLEEVWAASDFFLIPSVSEGTPLVLVEYLAIGKPVIASDISGNKELIRDKWNGFLFRTGEVNDLVEKIKHALEYRDIDSLRANARAFFVTHFQPEKTAREIEGTYREYA
jgi:glycosyltransferase involved in cell wall biosynthesis